MSSATNALEQDVGRALFLAQPFPAITEWHIHLYTTLPNEADGGGIELIGGVTGYAPIRFDPGAAHWQQEPNQDSLGRTVFSNKIPILSPVAVQAWPSMPGYGLRDQNGILRYVASFSPAVSVAVGHRLSFAIGQLMFPIG